MTSIPGLGRGFEEFGGGSLGYPRLRRRSLIVVAALVLQLLVSVGDFAVHCQTSYDTSPAPVSQAAVPTTSSQPRPHFVAFHEYEADALHVIRQNWTSQNAQFHELLKWVADGRHPCNSSAAYNFDNTLEFEGAWVGVFCTGALVESNATGFYHQVSLTKLMLYGSNSRCGWEYASQCGFNGIKGVLLPEIGRLVNLQYLFLDHHPELTGPVPLEIWQMPNLMEVAMQDNALSGTLASNVFNAASKLSGIYVWKNNFTGKLEVSLEGALFSSTLKYLNVTSNHLEGPLDLRNLNANATGALVHLAFDDNQFNGAFSIGPASNLQNLFLSKNGFTSIEFENARNTGVNMSSLHNLYVDNNKLSGPIPMEIPQMPNLKNLYLNGNNLSGSIDFGAVWINHIKSLDLSMNNFSGSVDLRNMYNKSELIYLNISNNNFNGTFFNGPYLNLWNMDLSNNYFNDIVLDIYKGVTPQIENSYMPLLKTLNIQNNKLTGAFPSQFLTAPNLQIIDASFNHYKTLQFPNVQLENSSLVEIFLTDNNIDSINPNDFGRFSTSNLQISNLLFLANNPLCNKIESVLLSTICRLNQSSPALKVVSELEIKNKIIIATSTSAAFGFVLLLTALYVWRLMGRIKSLHFILGEFEKKDVKPNLYSYKEIKLATKNFDKKNKLGEGGFGIVYKGELSDGTIVAVKKLTMSSSQMLSEFLNEVVVISGLKHRNLVKLKGCCLGDGDQRMLVFEYVENKNLAEALWTKGNLAESFEHMYLDWATRFNIIIGIARGLAYLHEDLQSPIIHRDIKACNILLDKNYCPKIADFGLAYLFPNLDDEASHLTLIQLAGTRGYFAPEYALHGHVSTSVDVYSFGIVVLEIISGRKSIDLQKSSEEVYLREWAWRQFKGQSSKTLIDPKMEHSSTDLEAILQVICVALSCIHYKPTMRPKMCNVVPMLLGNMSTIDFSTDFEYGEPIVDDESNLSKSSNTTSSSWKIEKIKVDECSLLNNAFEGHLHRLV